MFTTGLRAEGLHIGRSSLRELEIQKSAHHVGTTPRHFWLDVSMDLDLVERLLTLLHDASVEGLKRPNIVGIELRERIDLLRRDVQRGL